MLTTSAVAKDIDHILPGMLIFPLEIGPTVVGISFIIRYTAMARENKVRLPQHNVQQTSSGIQDRFQGTSLSNRLTDV